LIGIGSKRQLALNGFATFDRRQGCEALNCQIYPLPGGLDVTP